MKYPWKIKVTPAIQNFLPVKRKVRVKKVTKSGRETVFRIFSPWEKPEKVPQMVFPGTFEFHGKKHWSSGIKESLKRLKVWLESRLALIRRSWSQWWGWDEERMRVYSGRIHSGGDAPSIWRSMERETYERASNKRLRSREHPLLGYWKL